jgi:hypothetical protein
MRRARVELGTLFSRVHETTPEEVAAKVADVSEDDLFRRGAQRIVSGAVTTQVTAQHFEVEKAGRIYKRVRLSDKGIGNWFFKLKEQLTLEEVIRVEDYLRVRELEKEARLYGRAEQTLLANFRKYMSRHNNGNKRNRMTPRQFVTACYLATSLLDIDPEDQVEDPPSEEKVEAVSS